MNNIDEPNYLFTIGSDAKTVKGEKHNYITAIQYQLPHREVYEHEAFAKQLRDAGIDNYNACLWMGNCGKICLNTAGRGAFSSTQIARGKRTVFELLEPDAYKAKMRSELDKLIVMADRKQMTPCSRTNGTADKDYGWVYDEYPDLQFYDYTKSLKRLLTNRRSNYHLTFSYDGTAGNWSACKRAINAGYNVAICIGGKREDWPSKIYHADVIDGDELHGDLRFLDPKRKRGVFVGLTPKGKARKDTSGFVFQPSNN